MKKLLTAFWLAFGITCSQQAMANMLMQLAGTLPTGSPTPELLWWKLNAGSGTSITGYASAGGDGGTTDADWVTGKSGTGYALDYNGSSDEANTSSNITFGVNKITVCFWLNADATDSTRMLVENSQALASYADSFAIFINANTITGAVRGTSASYRIETCPFTTTGTYVHVAVVLDHSTTTGDVKIYLNGSLQTENITTNNKDAAGTFRTDVVYTGARASTTLHYAGLMDDIRIYSGDVSANLAAIIADPQ